MSSAQRQEPTGEVAFDTKDPDFIRDPYTRYAELRESELLHRTNDGLWVLTRHADVMSALRDGRLSSNPRHVDPDLRAGAASGLLGNLGIELMLTADPPEHTRLRRRSMRSPRAPPSQPPQQTSSSGTTRRCRSRCARRPRHSR